MRVADIAVLTPGDLPPYFSMTFFSHRLFLTAAITDVLNPVVCVIHAVFRAVGK